MHSLEALVLNSIYCLFPLLIYLFYVAYTKNKEGVENNLIFEIILFSIIYLNIKYGHSYFNVEPIILINIPLLVAYLKERKISILLISFFIVYYYIFLLGYNPGLITVEYIIYAIMYLRVKKGNLTKHYLINTFVLIKAAVLSFQSFYLIDKVMSESVIFVETFITSSTFYVLSYFILILLNECEKIISFNITLKELEKEKQLKKSLFMITHEIKNPIAVCKGYLDMFDVNNKNHCLKYVPIIKQEIDRTLTIMDDFLSINKIKIDKEVLDINLLLDDVCSSLTSLFKEKDIEAKIKILDTELFLWGDYNRLKQVFINVIKNAIEAIPKEKKGVIKINNKVVKKEVWITIEDNGIGMDKDGLAKLGEAFFTTKTKGSGLGLFLSKEIIKAHEGQLECESTKGKGTQIIIRLKLNYKT